MDTGNKCLRHQTSEVCWGFEIFPYLLSIICTNYFRYMSPSAATDCGQQDLGPESEKDPDVIPPNKGKQKIMYRID